MPFAKLHEATSAAPAPPPRTASAAPPAAPTTAATRRSFLNTSTPRSRPRPTLDTRAWRGVTEEGLLAAVRGCDDVLVDLAGELLDLLRQLLVLFGESGVRLEQRLKLLPLHVGDLRALDARLGEHLAVLRVGLGQSLVPVVLT